MKTLSLPLHVTLITIGYLAGGIALAQTPGDTVSSAPDQAALSSSDADVSEAAVMFERKCYSCHTIGQGDKKGPDLKDITNRRSEEWLQLYIPSARNMKMQGDPTAIELFEKYAPEEMTDQDLTAEQITLLLEFITQLSRENKPFIPPGARLSRDTTPEDIPIGHNLFTGRVAFESGRPACMTCHTITGVGLLGGGTLGPDLTQANIKYTVPELINIMQMPNFPLMSLIMKENEFTDEEIVQLIAYFQDVKTRQPDVQLKSLTFLYWGIGLAVIVLLLMGWIWRNRFISVRKPLVAGAGDLQKDVAYTAARLLSPQTGPGKESVRDS